MRSSKPILVVEDDRVDAMTIKRTFADIHVPNRVVLLSNGEEALDYLGNSQNDRPCIMLLDLNMPKMNGLEFLKIVKNDTGLKRIPVVVLTTSRDRQDRYESFDLGASGYMIKPIEHTEFINVIEAIDHYWTLSELPDEV